MELVDELLEVLIVEEVLDEVVELIFVSLLTTILLLDSLDDIIEAEVCCIEEIEDDNDDDDEVLLFFLHETNALKDKETAKTNNIFFIFLSSFYIYILYEITNINYNKVHLFFIMKDLRHIFIYRCKAFINQKRQFPFYNGTRRKYQQIFIFLFN